MVINCGQVVGSAEVVAQQDKDEDVEQMRCSRQWDGVGQGTDI